jgi:4-hydroxy-3-methylbut-2-enyl diphosphate reductase
VTPLLMLAPLRLEAAALRTPGARVLRTEMGASRARIAAARALAIDVRAVAVGGVCAGVAPGLKAGDLVCATELRLEGGRTTSVPAAAELAAALERRGLRAHLGPLLSLDRLAGPDERRHLSATGVLAVDMESAWLADGAGGRPFAVLRAVADPAGRRLVDPRTLLEGTRALLALRRAAPALAEWATLAEPLAPDLASELAATASTIAHAGARSRQTDEK